MRTSGRLASLLQVSPFALIMLLLVVVPLGIIFVVSFFDYGYAQIIPNIIWDNYTDIFRSKVTIDLYITAFRHVAIVWAITAVLGFFIAYYVIFLVQ